MAEDVPAILDSTHNVLVFGLLIRIGQIETLAVEIASDDDLFI